MTEADILATTYDDTCTVYRPFKPEVDIQQSDTIVVIQQGREIIVTAGRPAYYPSHNEVPATLVKERA